MSVHKLLLHTTIPGAPSTTRAVTTSLSSYQSFVAYGSGNNVVVRDIAQTSGEVVCCWRHTVPVTAVRISPSGRLVASGDQKGTVILWWRRPDTHEVLNTAQLEGPVRDLAWTFDEERLVVVGDGRSNFAVAIGVTGNTIGCINGHTQNILSCDMRGERPYRVVTGSADSMVGLYEGPPFKFVRNVKEHAEKVMCVRYSPDMESIATVSRSGDIVLLDGKTADTQKSIKTGHKGSIFSLAWSADGCKIVTASADKCVKIFDVCTGSLVATCAIGTAAADMQQGIVYTTQGIVSSSLSGKLTVVNEQGEVLRSILGHQGRILLVHKEPSGLIVSVSVDRALVWQDDKAAAVGNAYEVPLATDMINAAAASEGKLFLKAGDELLCYTLNDSKLDVLLKEAASVMALAPTVDGYIALLMKNSFVIAGPDGGKVAEEKFERFDGSSAASFGQMVAFGGDKVVKLYRVAPGAPPVETLCFSGHHTGCVSCVAFSHDGLLLASGDACRNIFVWSSTDGSLLYKDLVFHTLRVTSLAFSPANKGWLFSGGMDASLIVWDLESKKRRMEDMAHRGGVSAVFWAADETLLSGGSDGCVRIWKRE